MTQLLDAGPDFRKALTPIANDLFFEALAFARLIGFLDKYTDQPKFFQRYSERFYQIMHTLELMEEGIGLHFSGKIPYLYNGAAWSVSSPGGYTGLDGPKPHEVVATLRGLTGIVRTDERGFPERRPWKAVAYICLRDGQPAALDYALDLIEHGYIPYDTAAARCLAFILDGQAAKDPVGWARRRVPAISRANTGEGWADADVRGRVRNRLSTAELYNEQLLGRFGALIEETLASASADEFLVNRTRVQRLAYCLILLSKAAKEKNPPVAMLPLESLLEEIRADSYPIAFSISSAGTASSLLSLGHALQGWHNHNTTVMVMASHSNPVFSRALLPRALSDAPIGITLDDLAPEWRYFSYRIINPIAAACNCEPAWLAAKTRSSELDAVPPDSAAEDLRYVQFALASCDNPAQFAPAIDEYPWASSLRIQLARCLLKAGRNEEALREARIALHLEVGKGKYWRFLADVLDTCGASAEAHQARAISHALSDLETTSDVSDVLDPGQADEHPRTSIPLLKWTLTDREQALGEAHPEALTARDSLASAYQDAGRSGEAIPLLKLTLDQREQALGAAHPDTLRSRNQLAVAYRQAEQLGDSIPLLERVLADRERELGAAHPDTRASRVDLARAYREHGQPDDAIPLLEQILADGERELGAAHPDTHSSRAELATTYERAGRPGDAIALFQENLAGREQRLGQTHRDTLHSRNQLALAYVRAGRAGEAIPLLEQNLSDGQRVLGETHPDTLTSRHNLGVGYLEAGRLAEAISTLERTRADRQQALGHDHADTVQSGKDLAYARKALKEAKKERPARHRLRYE